MQVKIVNSTVKYSWYKDKIGEVFDVELVNIKYIDTPYYQLINDPIYLIRIEDATILRYDKTKKILDKLKHKRLLNVLR